MGKPGQLNPASRLRRVCLRTLLAIAALPLAASAIAQGMRLRRIGVLDHAYANPRPDLVDHEEGLLESLAKAMARIGFVAGRNIAYEVRYLNFDENRAATPAAELVQLKPDALVTQGIGATRALMRQTTSIPIVTSVSADPVVKGFAASLVRPGGNVTGISFIYRDIALKRLDLLRQIIPDMSGIASNSPRSFAAPPRAKYPLKCPRATRWR